MLLDNFSSEFILIHISNKINVETRKPNNLFKIEVCTEVCTEVQFHHWPFPTNSELKSPNMKDAP
jgi:hypothetical protein